MKQDLSIFAEIQSHLIQDEMPSQYFNQIIQEGCLQDYPLKMLSRMQQTSQSAKHHPEGNVWNHTMLVVDEAAKRKEQSKDAVALMWAALLHDIGKPDTTRKRKGRITAYDHDRRGAVLAGDFLQHYSCKEAFIQKVVALVRWHMQILYVVKDLPFADIPAMQKESDIEEIALLGLCDRLGRLQVNQALEENNIAVFLNKVRNTARSEG